MLGTVITIVGDRGASCIFQQRPHRQPHAKPTLSTAAQAHQDMKPFFKSPIPVSTRPPMGTAKPYLPESFVKREAEYHFLSTTQCCTYHRDGDGTEEADHRGKLLELATAEQELRQAGIGSFSLSSSLGDEDDDDMIREASISEARGCGTPYITRELQPIVRRIEWEQYILKCYSSVHIYAKKRDDGTRTLACNDKRWTSEDLTEYAPKMRELVGDRSIDDITEARARAKHYKKFVWSLMTPEQQGDWALRGPDTTSYLTREEAGPTIEDWDGDIHIRIIADQDVEGAFVTDSVPPPRPLSGPQELGLHSSEEVADLTIPWGDRIHKKGEFPTASSYLIGHASEAYIDSYEPSDRELEAWAELA